MARLEHLHHDKDEWMDQIPGKHRMVLNTIGAAASEKPPIRQQFRHRQPRKSRLRFVGVRRDKPACCRG
jgi:hypothetical protein